MTNKEIMIEEFSKHISVYENGRWVIIADVLVLDEIATNLLAKLQVLDRGKVRDILKNVLLPPLGNVPNLYIIEQINLIEDQICQLIPEGETVAEGKVTMDLPDLDIWYINGKQINGYFKKYAGKEIIVKVVKK